MVRVGSGSCLVPDHQQRLRIRTIRTDRGHEFQALFHWHVADLSCLSVNMSGTPSSRAMRRDLVWVPEGARFTIPVSS